MLLLLLFEAIPVVIFAVLPHDEIGTRRNRDYEKVRGEVLLEPFLRNVRELHAKGETGMEDDVPPNHEKYSQMGERHDLEWERGKKKEARRLAELQPELARLGRNGPEKMRTRDGLREAQRDGEWTRAREEGEHIKPRAGKKNSNFWDNEDRDVFDLGTPPWDPVVPRSILKTNPDNRLSNPENLDSKRVDQVGFKRTGFVTQEAKEKQIGKANVESRRQRGPSPTRKITGRYGMVEVPSRSPPRRGQGSLDVERNAGWGEVGTDVQTDISEFNGGGGGNDSWLESPPGRGQRQRESRTAKLGDFFDSGRRKEKMGSRQWSPRKDKYNYDSDETLWPYENDVSSHVGTLENESLFEDFDLKSEHKHYARTVTNLDSESEWEEHGPMGGGGRGQWSSSSPKAKRVVFRAEERTFMDKNQTGGRPTTVEGHQKPGEGLHQRVDRFVGSSRKEARQERDDAEWDSRGIAIPTGRGWGRSRHVDAPQRRSIEDGGRHKAPPSPGRHPNSVQDESNRASSPAKRRRQPTPLADADPPSPVESNASFASSVSIGVHAPAGPHSRRNEDKQRWEFWDQQLHRWCFTSGGDKQCWNGRRRQWERCVQRELQGWADEEEEDQQRSCVLENGERGQWQVVERQTSPPSDFQSKLFPPCYEYWNEKKQRWEYWAGEQFPHWVHWNGRIGRWAFFHPGLGREAGWNPGTGQWEENSSRRGEWRSLTYTALPVVFEQTPEMGRRAPLGRHTEERHQSDKRQKKQKDGGQRQIRSEGPKAENDNNEDAGSVFGRPQYDTTDVDGVNPFGGRATRRTGGTRAQDMWNLK